MGNAYDGLAFEQFSMEICIVARNLLNSFHQQDEIVNTFIYSHIWAMTCDFQQGGILTSVDSDEPVQPPLSLETSNYVWPVAYQS